MKELIETLKHQIIEQSSLQISEMISLYLAKGWAWIP